MKLGKKMSLCAGALALFLFTVLTIFVINENVGAFNNAVHSRIILLETPALTSMMRVLDVTGALYGYIPVIIVLLIIPRTRNVVGVTVAIAILVSELLNRILKLTFAVPRPAVESLVNVSGYGHPSGHSMNAMVFAGVCAVLFLFSSHKKPFKIAAFAIAAVYILVMGFSRIYLGVHSTTDVLAGYSAGVFVLCMICYLWKDNRVMR